MEPIRTITVTENSQPSNLVLTLKRRRIDYGSALDRLADIVETVGNNMYETWHDPLSFNLMKWSSKAMLIDLSDESKIDELFEKNVINTIDKLEKKVLVDHVEKTPLKDPVLVVKTLWTCEKSYVEMSGMNFIPEELVTVVPHPFASAMITWISSLKEDSSLPPNISTEVAKVGQRYFSETEMESIKRSFFKSYKIKARNEFATQFMRHKSQTTQQDTVEMAFVRKIIEERLQEKTKEAKAEASERFEQLYNRIENLEETSKETFEILHAKAEKQEQKLEKVEKEALELKIANMHLQAKESNLRFEIECRKQEIAMLNARVDDDDDGWCIIQ